MADRERGEEPVYVVKVERWVLEQAWVRVRADCRSNGLHQGTCVAMAGGSDVEWKRGDTVVARGIKATDAWKEDDSYGQRRSG
jgi:hypothetical protein